MENIVKRYDDFVVVDLETSHFHPEKGAMIIEIGAVRIKGDKIIDEFSSLIDPERKITSKITEITGITNEMLIGQPTYREVLPSFYEFCKNSVIVAHNSMFDWDRFLLHFFKKVGIYPNNPVVDTLRLSKKYFPKNPKGYSLSEICNLIGIKNENSHRAVSDARVTAEILLYMKRNFISPPDNQLTLGEVVNSGTPEILENKPIKQNVRKIAYWEKQVTKNKMMQRAYITLDKAVVFFDIPTQSWEVKSSNGPIDFNQVETDVKSFLKIKSMDEIRDYFKQ